MAEPGYTVQAQVSSSAGSTVAIVSLGALALLATLFWIVFVGRAREEDVDSAKLHDTDYALKRKLRGLEDKLEGIATPPAAPAVKATLATDVPGATAATTSASTTAPSNPTVDDLVKRIVETTTPAERAEAFAKVFSQALSKEQMTAIVAGISPLGGTGTTMTDLERLKELARVLKDGDVSGGVSIAGNTTALLAMYEQVLTSLGNSSVVSDDTRKLLSQIKIQKCQMEFARDPVALTNCITTVLSGTSNTATTTTPAAGGTTPTTTTPAVLAPTTAVNTSINVLPDGLVATLPGGKSAKFTFNDRTLSVCSEGNCRSAVLMSPP